MGKKSITRPRKRKASDRRHAPRGKPIKTPESLYLSDYHQLVFALLESDAATHAFLLNATLEPRRKRSYYWSSPDRTGAWSGDAAWLQLNAYLQTIEIEIAAIVEQHTHFYWLHLYRRIGVTIHRALNRRRDPRTVALVRGIAEAAFVRYGRLEDAPADMALSTEISLGQVAGGLYLQGLRTVISTVKRGSEALLNIIATAMKQRPCWLLRSFTQHDYVDIYRIEALAYEYWFTTALMRRVGKGSELLVAGDGTLQSPSSPDFELLISSYDERTEKQQFNSSSLAVAFYESARSGTLTGLFASYNVDRTRFSDVALSETVPQLAELVTNFYFAPFALGAYAEAHSFAATAFKAKREFSWHSFCGYVAAVSLFEFGYAALDAPNDVLSLMNYKELYQRAYVINKSARYYEVLTEQAVAIMDSWLGAGNHQMAADAPLVREFLTMRRDKQCGTGLWSLGPRYVFVPHGAAVLVDLNAFTVILHNAFVGLSLAQSEKGTVFEEEFRRYVERAGLELLPERTLKIGSTVRESDALVRCRDTLFICECRAMERPLDFEVGRVRTIARRIADLQEKLQQATSLARILQASPRGANYDFSWAGSVVALVVSPFVEWIWSRSEELWLTENVPAILSATEAVAFMKRSEGRP